MSTNFHIRDAVASESSDIASLFLISSDGLAEYIWSPLLEPGETLLQAGARRYARRETAFSFENCQVAVDETGVVGMVHAFPMIRDPGFDPHSVDPVLRPYTELEDYGSFYVSGIAVHESRRNRGIGGQLLTAAELRAADLSFPRVSLICFDRNTAAMRLYERYGYREIDRRPLVPHPCLHYQDGDAILLARPIGDS